jgi:hypothetical protein
VFCVRKWIDGHGLWNRQENWVVKMKKIVFVDCRFVRDKMIELKHVYNYMLALEFKSLGLNEEKHCHLSEMLI